MSDELEKLPIPAGEWVQTKETPVVSLPFVKQQRDLLASLAEALEGQIKEDQFAILGLEEQLMRFKRGGSNG